MDLFLRLSCRQLQIERTQFPSETVEAETELDALVVKREIAWAGKKGMARFRPIDLAVGTVEAREGGERAGVFDRRGIGDNCSQPLGRDVGVDEAAERIVRRGGEELGKLVFLFLCEHSKEVIADLLLERTADGLEVHPRGERVQVVGAKRFAETPDGIVRGRQVEKEERRERYHILRARTRTPWRFRSDRVSHDRLFARGSLGRKIPGNLQFSRFQISSFPS